MLTYEDFLACGNDQRARIEFIKKAIAEHENSRDYITAQEAHEYYRGENPTIMKYEKILYDMYGKAHADMWTANHKIASKFYGNAVNQEVAYLLGNGVRFGEKETKKKLGNTFDLRMMRAEIYARTSGQSFLFWNYDHVDVFKFTEFAPIYGEKTGALMLGIRHWSLGTDKPLQVTLYEIDGYTELSQKKGEEMTVVKEKRPYKMRTVRTRAEGEIQIAGENYAGFPIVPLYANEDHRSTLCGRRNTIDALDLARSGMVNNVDEGALIYWVLNNCGGMDDLDDAKFIERLKTTHVAHADGDAGAAAEAHTLEAPFDGTKVTVDEMKAALYEDFQSFDSKAVVASNQSATAVRASYIPLDLKTDIEIEPFVTECILRILELAGIDDNPTYQRNQLINKLEETQTLVMQAEFLPEDYITEKLLAINGDIDRLEDMQKQKDAEAADRLIKAEERLKAMEAENPTAATDENNEGGAE